MKMKLKELKRKRRKIKMSKPMSPEVRKNWKDQVENKVIKLKIDIENWQSSVKRAQGSLKKCKKNLKLYEEEFKRLKEEEKGN